MFPVLISFGSFNFYTFNLCLILGLIIALYMVWKKAREEVEDEEKILDLSLLAIVFGLLGGRIVEGILSWRVFGLSLYKLLAFWRYPGFSIWGAFGVSSIALFWISIKRRLNFAKIADYLASGLVIFIPFVFLGHFFNGSYYGAQTSFFWGITVPGLLGKRHPTAIIGFFVSLLILLLVYKFSVKKHFDGAVSLFTISLFSLFSFTIEWLRGDSLYLERKVENLIFAAIAFVASTSLFYFKSKRDVKEDLDLVFKILTGLSKKFVFLVTKLTKRKKKIWQIRETHYKI